MKITEEDLKEVFSSDTEEPIANLQDGQVSIKKVKKIDEINKIRRSIKRINQEKPKSIGGGFELINSLLRFTAIAGFSGFIIFVGMSWGGLSEQLKWAYYVDFKGERPPGAVASVTSKPSLTPYPSPKAYISSQPVAPVDNLPSLHADFTQNNLKIDKISINAPIMWEVEEDKILDQLTGGVAHYKGTSLPGQGGNIFIVGHSSNYFWIKSDYNNIFALLDKLSPGDRIEVSRNNSNFIYEVKETKVIKPDEVQVLENTPKETLSLMTCWPLGTSLKRMVVQSELIYSYSAD